MAVQLTTMRDLFIFKLRSLQRCEEQMADSLPRMSKAATDEELQAAFQEHLHETKLQLKRIQDCLAELGVDSPSELNPAIQGILAECDVLIQAKGASDPAVIDAALIGAAQDLEHYEIAAYGTARAWAGQLGLDKIAQQLQKSLDEEGQADKLLTRLAEDHINRMASEYEQLSEPDTTSGASLTGSG